LRVPWRETIVALEWRTNQPFDIGAVYGAWPKDGEEDEYFRVALARVSTS